MKLESLVIVGQLYHGEYVPGPCTPARQTMEVGAPEVADEAPKAKPMTGAKS